MVLDLGIYFSEQFVLKRVGSNVIISNGGEIRIKKIHLKLSKAHLEYHRGKSNKIKEIKKIFKNPEYLLEEDENIEAKFKLYISMKSRYKYKPSLSLEGTAGFIISLINLDHPIWTELRNLDFELYEELKVEMGYKYINRIAASIVNEHIDFCIQDRPVTCYISEFQNKYKKMISEIASGGKPGYIIDHPFYEECILLREFFLSGVVSNPQNMKTLNERGIYNFLKENSNI